MATPPFATQKQSESSRNRVRRAAAALAGLQLEIFEMVLFLCEDINTDQKARGESSRFQQVVFIVMHIIFQIFL